MSIALYVIAGVVVLGSLITIAKVDKPRKPISGSDAVTIVAINAAVIVVLVIAAMELS